MLKWCITVHKELNNVLCIDCSLVLCEMLTEGVNCRSFTSCLTLTLHLETSVSFTLYSVDFVTWSAVIVRMQVRIIPFLLTECWNTVKRKTCSSGGGFDSLIDHQANFKTLLYFLYLFHGCTFTCWAFFKYFTCVFYVVLFLLSLWCCEINITYCFFL